MQCCLSRLVALPLGPARISGIRALHATSVVITRPTRPVLPCICLHDPVSVGAVNPHGLPSSRSRYYSNRRKEDLREGPKESRHAKKRMGLVVAYAGNKYKGSQYNEGLETVEGKLLDAIGTAGLCLETSSGSLSKVGFVRASRTDRGVHALRSAFSAKMMYPFTDNEDEDAEDICNKLNEHLPDEIRVISATRLPKVYNLRRNCYYRSYTYMVPKELLGQNVETMKDAMQLMQGVNNYHNFTQRSFSKLSVKSVSFRDRTVLREVFMDRPEKMVDWTTKSTYCIRTVYRMRLEDPVTIGGLEFFPITVAGGSFMRRQILTMVSTILAVSHSTIDVKLLEAILKSPVNVDLPIAPPHYLFLDYVGFTPGGYYTRYFDSEEDQIYNHPHVKWGNPRGEEAVREFWKQQLLPAMLEAHHSEQAVTSSFLEKVTSWQLQESVKSELEAASETLRNIEEQRKALGLEDKGESALEFLRVRDDATLEYRKPRVEELEDIDATALELPNGLASKLILRYGLRPGWYASSVLEGLRRYFVRHPTLPMTLSNCFQAVETVGLTKLGELGAPTVWGWHEQSRMRRSARDTRQKSNRRDSTRLFKKSNERK